MVRKGDEQSVVVKMRILKLPQKISDMGETVSVLPLSFLLGLDTGFVYYGGSTL
jgi:hypothetical protein